ncbi:MAG: ABC transporter substrate-binding protein [Caldilineaceae bacterium]
MQQRKMSRREFLSLTAVSSTGILLAACVAPPSSTGQGAGANVAKEGVELQFWGTAEPQTLQPEIDKWNEEHPESKVNYLFTPGVSSVGTNPKFLAATLGGNPPDVVWHDGSNYVTSASLNAFEELESLATRDAISSDLYWEAFWPKVNWKGHLYGLPFNTDARALYWNKSYFEEAGLSAAPKSIDELDSMVDALTKGSKEQGYDRVGFIPWVGNWFLLAWGWDWGAELWDEKSNKLHLNAPEMIKALEWEVGYAQKYGVEELTAFTKSIAGETTDAFVTGNTAMEATGNWVISDLQNYAPDLAYEIAPVPAPEGRSPITWSGGFVLGIPRGAKHLEASWNFLKYETGKDAQLGYCTRMNTIPTHKEASQGFADAHPEQKIFVDLLTATHIEPVIPEWEKAWDAHIQAEQEALYGRKSAQQALDEANAKVQEIIDNRLKEMG